MENSNKKDLDLLMANAVRETYATKVRNINNGIGAVDKVYKKISRARTQSKDSIRNALKDATSEFL